MNKMVLIFSFSSFSSVSYDGLDWPTKRKYNIFENKTLLLQVK